MQPDPQRALRRATRDDIEAIVTIHLRSFPGFFLSFLGRRFLHELYQGIWADPAGMIWVVEESGRVAGFVAGTLEPAGFYRRLIRRRVLWFAVAAVGPLLRRPLIFARLWRALRKPAESRTGDEPAALLMSIAVDPAAQNRSVGEMLVEAFCRECARHDAWRVTLTTDRDANEAVNRFYVRRGFVATRNFVTPEGRAMIEYARRLRQGDGTAGRTTSR